MVVMTAVSQRKSGLARPFRAASHSTSARNRVATRARAERQPFEDPGIAFVGDENLNVATMTAKPAT